MRACFSAAHCSMRSFAQPLSTAFVIPPIASTSSMIDHAWSAMSCVSRSMRYDPAQGSITLQMCVSSWISSCVLRAMRAEKSVGSAIASSNELVCSDWVPPNTAAIASIVVRTTLLYGSCSVSDQPDVWQWVRSIIDFGLFGANDFMIRHHRSRAARSLATSR